MKRINFDDLAVKAHATAVSKGWWPIPPSSRPFSEVFANFHSEVDEAWEEFRKWGMSQSRFIYTQQGTPEGIAIELADLLIRLADAKQAYGWHTIEHSIGPPRLCPSFPLLVNTLHAHIVYHYTDVHTRGPDGVYGEIAEILAHVEGFCQVFNVPLQDAIGIKLEYNKTRPYRHDGKKA